MVIVLQFVCILCMYLLSGVSPVKQENKWINAEAVKSENELWLWHFFCQSFKWIQQRKDLLKDMYAKLDCTHTNIKDQCERTDWTEVKLSLKCPFINLCHKITLTRLVIYRARQPYLPVSLLLVDSTWASLWVKALLNYWWGVLNKSSGWGWVLTRCLTV